MTPYKTFIVYNHQHKADQYINALRKAGYQYALDNNPRVLLMDMDTPGRINAHKQSLRSGKTLLFTYPHAASPNVAWDGIIKCSQYTTATFVSAEGHIEILRAYGYKKPIHVAGWAFCDTLPFKPNPSPRKILFAPIHPTKRGFLSTVDGKINADTLNRLLNVFYSGKISLSIRYLKGLANNGLPPPVNGVNYIEGATDLSYKDIDAHDLIVSRHTFAYMALARGKPVLMMAEDTPPRNGGSEHEFKYVASWDKYKDLMMYPLDILSCDDVTNTWDMIQRAAESDEDVINWKRRMIGSPFDAESVVNAIESYP